MTASKNGLEVRGSRLGGRGVFATKAVHRGGRLGRWVGERAATWSAQNDCHACWMEFPDGWRCYTGRGRLRFLNHASRANSDFRGLELYAIQDILAGDEVTIDYSNGSGRIYEWGRTQGDQIGEAAPPGRLFYADSSSRCPRSV